MAGHGSCFRPRQQQLQRHHCWRRPSRRRSRPPTQLQRPTRQWLRAHTAQLQLRHNRSQDMPQSRGKHTTLLPSHTFFAVYPSGSASFPSFNSPFFPLRSSLRSNLPSSSFLLFPFKAQIFKSATIDGDRLGFSNFSGLMITCGIRNIWRSYRYFWDCVEISLDFVLIFLSWDTSKIWA